MVVLAGAGTADGNDDLLVGRKNRQPRDVVDPREGYLVRGQEGGNGGDGVERRGGLEDQESPALILPAIAGVKEIRRRRPCLVFSVAFQHRVAGVRLLRAGEWSEETESEDTM